MKILRRIPMFGFLLIIIDLFILLGKAFASLLPMGDVGFRLNVMSALCGAATVLLLYHLARRLVRARAAALAAALLFAFSYYFWAQAVVAEVYTLHTLLLCALLLLLLRWESSRADRLLAAAGLVYGLSLGNHMSSILVAPALAAFFLAVAGKEALAPRRLLLLAGPSLDRRARDQAFASLTAEARLMARVARARTTASAGPFSSCRRSIRSRAASSPTVSVKSALVFSTPATSNHCSPSLILLPTGSS